MPTTFSVEQVTVPWMSWPLTDVISTVASGDAETTGALSARAMPASAMVAAIMNARLAKKLTILFVILIRDLLNGCGTF